MDKELGVLFVYKQGGEAAIAKVHENLKKTTTEAHSATTAVERFAKAVERAGATEALGRPGGILSGALGGGPGAIIGLGAAGGLVGMIAEADHLASSAARLSTEVLRNSDAVGMNAQSYQTWSHLSEMAGIGTDQLTRMLTHFNVQLESGAPLLKNAHTSLAQLGITSTDSGAAMLKLADYFHNTNDAAQQAAIAQGLFGRGAAGMIDILKQGSGAFLTYQKHLEDMGLLLTDAQLKQGALANTIHNEFGEALKGIELQVGVRLEAGFMQLWGTMTAVAGGGKKLFEDLGQVIGNVVSFIAGAVGAIFGVSQDQIHKSMEESLQALGAYQGLGGAAQDAVAPVDALGASTKRLDQALQQQIADLNEQQKAYDNVVAAQTRSIDAQIKELQLSQAQATAADALAKAKETLSGDNANIAKTQAQLEQDMFDGNVSKAQATNIQLQAERKKLGDDTATIANDQHKAETQSAIDTLNDKKSSMDDEKRQRDQVFQDAIGKLRDQVSANQAAQGQMQLSNANTVSASKAGIADFSAFFKSMNSGNALDWAAKGADMVKKFQGWVSDIKTALDNGGLAGVAAKLGSDIGSALMSSMGRAIEGAAAHFIASNQDLYNLFGQGDLAKTVVKQLNDHLSHQSGSADTGNAGGKSLYDIGRAGILSYAVGTSYVPNDGLAYLHRGEAVIPAAQNAGGMGHNISLNFYGVGPDIAAVVRREVSTILSQVS